MGIHVTSLKNQHGFTPNLNFVQIPT